MQWGLGGGDFIFCIAHDLWGQKYRGNVYERCLGEYTSLSLPLLLRHIKWLETQLSKQLMKDDLVRDNI